jgi:hypothetical protein
MPLLRSSRSSQGTSGTARWSGTPSNFPAAELFQRYAAPLTAHDAEAGDAVAQDGSGPSCFSPKMANHAEGGQNLGLATFGNLATFRTG